MAQDITSLGIDISSFSPAKLTRLNEFITAFDKLDKFNGKTLNLLSGGGLSDFNSSVAQTNKLLDELNLKMQTLNATKISPDLGSAAVQNIRTFNTEVEGATTRTKKLSSEFSNTGFSIATMGKELTKSLSLLRTIAYILPGIGLAGIFNLAGEAIVKVIDYLGEYGNSVQNANAQDAELIDNLITINKLLRENIDLNYGLNSVQQLKYQKDDLSYYKSLGENLGFIIDKKIEIADLDKKDAQKAINASTGLTGTDALQKQVYLVSKLSEELEKLNKQKIALDEGKLKFGSEGTEKGQLLPTRRGETYTNAKEDVEAFDKKLDNTRKFYEQQLGLLNAFNKASSDINDAIAERVKFQSDQERKILVDTTKNNLDVIFAKNKAILADERTMQKERLDVVSDTYKKEKELANANRINITGTSRKYGDSTENPNLSATPADITVALNKQSDDVKKSLIKRNEDTLKINTDYYQRLIKAVTESQKDEIETDAIANERIYQNDKITLDKRLAAYTAYILDKQLIQQLELQKDLQQGASKPGDKTSLTSEEQQRLQDDKTKENLNLQANAQKQIYDIVYSSLQKQLKALKDEKEGEFNYEKEQYINDLTALNDRLERKEITIKRYNELRKRLDRKDQKDVLISQIAEDEKYLAELRRFKQEQLDIETKSAKSKLDEANKGGDKYQIDKAKGEHDAALQAENDFNKEMAAAQKKREDDRLKLAKLGGDNENKERKEWYSAALEIERALYNTIKTLGDEDYERRIAMVEKRKALLDQQYDSEIDAIEKSSLTAKDKAALDIQLQAQKQALDEKAALDERRLKIKEFEFDRKLAIGHIIISTALGVAKAIPDIPKEIAAAAVGAIELATVLAQQPPSYRYGTPASGHPGGIARFGEAGPEVVKEPYKSPYLVVSETISYLPKGTDVIPVKDSPNFGETISDGWEQTKWLGGQIRKSNKEIKNIFRPIINIDLGFEKYKHEKLHGR